MRLTGPEWTIMNALWADHPATARMIHEAVSPSADWAYDTVRTILNRLARKGIVKSQVIGNTAHFEPLLSRDEARRTALGWIKAKAFGGASSSLLHFLVSEEELSEKERQELAKLFRELED